MNRRAAPRRSGTNDDHFDLTCSLRPPGTASDTAALAVTGEGAVAELLSPTVGRSDSTTARALVDEIYQQTVQRDQPTGPSACTVQKVPSAVVGIGSAKERGKTTPGEP